MKYIRWRYRNRGNHWSRTHAIHDDENYTICGWYIPKDFDADIDYQNVFYMNCLNCEKRIARDKHITEKG